VRRFGEFQSLPVRLLAGHSRKSFLNLFGERTALEREPESLGVSLALAARGADIIRVHEPEAHRRAWLAFQEAYGSG
jgi:dihydropteroate synthase